MRLVTIPDPQPKYPDTITARAPIGMRDQIRRAANVERLPAAEFVRRALEQRIASVLVGERAHG
jgi:uncharacterized protein (DUF1778 family)